MPMDYLIDREQNIAELLEKLESKGYFDGASKGSEEYNKRRKAAEQSFDAKLADVYKDLGNKVLLEKKEFRKAIELYTTAAFLNATAVIYCNLAAAYFAVGDTNSSIECCTKSLDIDPKFSKSYNRLGLNYAKSGKLAEAKEAFQKAIDLEPSNAKYKEELRNVENAIQQQQ